VIDADSDQNCAARCGRKRASEEAHPGVEEVTSELDGDGDIEEEARTAGSLVGVRHAASVLSRGWIRRWGPSREGEAVHKNVLCRAGPITGGAGRRRSPEHRW
jgi:hypothetical protein